MYQAHSHLDKGFTVSAKSTFNQDYTLKMNEEADGPMDLFTVAFSGCILMCAKGYFFRKYNLVDLPMSIDLSVDYDNKKYQAIIKVNYPDLSVADKEGILENIRLRCKISHLLSPEVTGDYIIEEV